MRDQGTIGQTAETGLGQARCGATLARLRRSGLVGWADPGPAYRIEQARLVTPEFDSCSGISRESREAPSIIPTGCVRATRSHGRKT